MVAPIAIRRRTDSLELALFTGTDSPEARKGSAPPPLLLLCRLGDMPMAAALEERRSGTRGSESFVSSVEGEEDVIIECCGAASKLIEGKEGISTLYFLQRGSEDFS